jgi:Domain of unknown function (DUF4372)/Transposase DDE domain
MNTGKYIFSQVISILPKYEFDKSVAKFGGDYKVQDFTCWSQFLCMMFGQLTARRSLRDTVICLNAHTQKLYHIGLKNKVSKSTLAHANESRDWKIYEDFAHKLIAKLVADKNSKCKQRKAYAIDSTTIDLCLNVFWWASFRKKKAAIKLHTMIDLDGDIPTFIHITNGKVQDVLILDYIAFEVGAFYVIDRGYFDFNRLFSITSSAAFFVTRTKRGMIFERIYSKPVDKTTGVIYDQVVKTANSGYRSQLRRVKYFDKERNKKLIFLTNNFEITALEVAMLYKKRWQIELFFKWIKQNLKIKSFWGQSENAVRVQIWIAICTYLLVALLKKELKIKLSVYKILQIISVSPFDKTNIYQLLTEKHTTPPSQQQELPL